MLEYFAKLVEFCAKNDIMLASDNPYVDVTFGDYKAPSVLDRFRMPKMLLLNSCHSRKHIIWLVGDSVRQSVTHQL